MCDGWPFFQFDMSRLFSACYLVTLLHMCQPVTAFMYEPVPLLMIPVHTVSDTTFPTASQNMLMDMVAPCQLNNVFSLTAASYLPILSLASAPLPLPWLPCFYVV